MSNENLKTYTFKELASILRTDYTVVSKKVKKYKLTTDKQMINGRQTTVVKIANEVIEAINQEIEHFRKKNINQLPPNNQTLVDDLPPNEQPQHQVITREQADFSIKLLIEKLSESHQKEVQAKDEIIKILKENILKLETENQQLKNRSFFGFKY